MVVGQIQEFNTGCHYTKEGQVIRWRVTQQGTTEFIDCSRGIWGTIQKLCKTNHEVNTEYINNRYEQGGFHIYKELRRMTPQEIKEQQEYQADFERQEREMESMMLHGD